MYHSKLDCSQLTYDKNITSYLSVIKNMSFQFKPLSIFTELERTIRIGIYKNLLPVVDVQWNPSCEATPFASEKWPFQRGWPLVSCRVASQKGFHCTKPTFTFTKD